MSNGIYIHYGHKQFDGNLFDEIQNEQFVKPLGGLWASNIKAKYGWKDWCTDNEFRECKEENSFKFKLKDGTRILKIDNAKILKELPTDNTPYKFGWVTLDFEELTKTYDAIEVLISNDGRLYYDLYGWDCDSLLVLNKECIEVLSK